jgi:hypothetical protein
MDDGVLVFCGDTKGVRQPEHFRCCPLGLQFYSRRKLDTFSILDFRLDAPSRGGRPSSVTCSGVVVQCQRSKPGPMYRTWVMFLDLPESIRRKLKCVAHMSDTLCPHCENF